MKAIIIGSGIAGLASAVRLARMGLEVEVYEANGYPGGKLSEFVINGFRFDAGPSLFTLPNLVTELFTLCGKNPESAFPYFQLEKSCNYFYEDGTSFSAFHDKNKFAQELSQKIQLKDSSALFHYLNKAEYRYNLTYPIFIENSLHKFKNYLNFNTVKGIINSYKLNPFGNMNRENKQLLDNPYLVQYFNRFATYNGSNPYQAPALLNMIPHLEHNIGTYFPKGGMHQITTGIFELAKEQGVTFHFNNKVKSIKTSNNKVVGIQTNDGIKYADIVISNADIHTTYRQLLKDTAAPEKLLQQEKSSSALIFYWGINRSFEELDLHNIFFSNNYEEEFNSIFKLKTIYHDPTVYINITSKYKVNDAPKGCENWFVMINVPHHSGQHWDSLINDARNHIINKLNRMLNINLQELICAEHMLEPRTIESKTSSFGGALYGNASNNKYSAFLRHKNFSSSIKGLYFCGGSVHPGGGIPLCLNSAKITTKIIREEYKL